MAKYPEEHLQSEAAITYLRGNLDKAYADHLALAKAVLAWKRLGNLYDSAVDDRNPDECDRLMEEIEEAEAEMIELANQVTPTPDGVDD